MRAGGVEAAPRADKVTLWAAQGLTPALAFRLLALEVGADVGMYARLRDRDPVQGAVELAVARAVEPVALSLTEGGLQRGGA